MSAAVPFAAPDPGRTGSIAIFDGRTVRRVAYRQVAADVAAARARLEQAGVEPGMCVGILGENCYEWMIHDLALLALGAVPVCFPIDEMASRTADDLADAYDLSLLLVTRKTGAGRGDVPWIVTIDAEPAPAAVRPAGDRGLRARIRGTDVCTVIFSSGTSGLLKALLLSRAGVEDTIEALAGDWALGPGDGLLVALPLSIFQQRLMIYASLRRDADILLTDSLNLFRSFKALQPTVVLGPPALFETVEKRFHAQPRRGRKLFGFAREAFGGRIRVLLTGSAPSKRSTLEFYRRAGIALYQCYGLAEVGFIAWNRPGHDRLMSVGRPIVPGSVQIAGDGEVILALPHPQSIGYFGVDPAEEARTFLPDGRIATGDLGHLDRAGFLHLTGRKKNIILTQGGEKIHPESLEHELGVVAGVERAVVIGGADLPGLVSVIAVDPACSDGDEARIRADVQRAVDGLNSRVKPSSRITRVLVTRVPFRPETGLVTRNLKLDRRAVQRYFERELS